MASFTPELLPTTLELLWRLPHGGCHGAFSEFKKCQDYATVLRRLRDGALSATPWTENSLAELFGCLAGVFNAVVLETPAEWINSGEAVRGQEKMERRPIDRKGE